jgi:CBS domain-containing protein
MLATERVDQVMSQVALSLDLNQTVGAALDLLATRPCHHLPVLSGRKVIGLLTPSDLMNHDGSSDTGAGVINVLKGSVKLAKLLRRTAITIEPHASLADAARMMIANAVHALPVVDAQEHLLGIITSTDVMNAALRVESRDSAAPPEERAVDTLPEHTGTGAPPERSLESSELQMSDTRFDLAVAAAKESIEQGQDGQDIAQALLLSQRRCTVLDRVLVNADRYLHAGEDPPLHAALIKAVAEAKRLRGDGVIEPQVMI